MSDFQDYVTKDIVASSLHSFGLLPLKEASYHVLKSPKKAYENIPNLRN